jgi:hypothetical protein
VSLLGFALLASVSCGDSGGSSSPEPGAGEDGSVANLGTEGGGANVGTEGGGANVAMDGSVANAGMDSSVANVGVDGGGAGDGRGTPGADGAGGPGPSDGGALADASVKGFDAGGGSGGCTTPAEGSFYCGTTLCSGATSYCLQGSRGFTCEPLPAACGRCDETRDCDCMLANLSSPCDAGTLICTTMHDGGILWMEALLCP